MSVLLYEYSCANSGILPESLCTEGRAMFDALRADLAGRDVVIVDRDDKLREAARSAEYAIVIAPEFDGLLAERCAWVEEAGAKLLSASSKVVKQVSDKLDLGRSLRAHSVPAPRVWSWQDRDFCAPVRRVVKPRVGAGSQAMCLVEPNEPIPAIDWSGELMVQEYVPGQAVSVVSLVGPRQRLCLPPATQQLAGDGSFRYLGGRVPWPGDVAKVHALANQVLDLFPDLRGYVGMDMVVGAEGPMLIEINARWTTSYLGLRAICRDNLVQLLIDVVNGTPCEDPRWREGSVEFKV